MPAPKFLAGLPKPLLFGLYGAVGGFVGALVIAEPLHQISHFLDERAKGAGRAFLLLAGAGAWTAGIAAPLCLALLGGQHHYLRGSLPDLGRVALGLVGGAAAGVVGGVVGQFCFCFAPQDIFLNCLARIFAWALLGGLVGGVLSFFIPNMRRLLGASGGTVGGGVGCVLFLAASCIAGGTVGRMVGGGVLGFCIGVMVVVAERAFRRAWLEVRFGEREVVTVTLGPEPVKIGSNAKACTVWARGAAAVALRFFVRDGEVICDDHETGDEAVAEDGFAREVGNVTVTVRTSGEPAAPRRRPVARPASQPAALSLDDDDGFSPPLPAASSPAPSPRPAPAVPAMKPAIKPTTKDPAACPSCGRVVPGASGARYCMLCDRTY